MASDILDNCWHISPEGLSLITADNTVKDKSKVLRNALDSDLKEIGSPVLPKELSKSSISQVVLQIQKIRNIAAPKANENSQAAPRMLKLVLTDGDSYIQAIETSPIPSISKDKTSPGSKILITSAPIVSGYILLNDKNCKLLGGQVAALYEKWVLAKGLEIYNRRTATTDGAPAWVNFGGKISADAPDSQFKSLENKNKDAVKDNTEFEQQRQGAIAEATSGAVRKVFGGGTKQAVLNSAIPTYPTFRKNNEYPGREDRRGNRTKNFSNNEEEVDEKPLKPLERVSLFDFLEDKLPVTEAVSAQNETGYQKQGFNNNARPNQSYQYYQQNRGGAKPPFQKFDHNRGGYSKYDSRPRPSYNQNDQSGNRPFESRNKPSYEQNSNYDRSRPAYGHNEQSGNKPFRSKPPYEQSGYSDNRNKPFCSQNEQISNRPVESKSKPPYDQSGNNDNRSKSYSQNEQISNRPVESKSKPPYDQSGNNDNRSKSYGQNEQSSNKPVENHVKPSSNQTNHAVSDLGNGMERMSLHNSQFASRSLRQHLNLGSPGSGSSSSKKIDGASSPNAWNWRIGDDCMAKYWEDGKYYNANVTAITDKTCVVKFKGYGNIEEVLKSDCLPVSGDDDVVKKPRPGPMEFRRSAKTYRNK